MGIFDKTLNRIGYKKKSDFKPEIEKVIRQEMAGVKEVVKDRVGKVEKNISKVEQNMSKVEKDIGEFYPGPISGVSTPDWDLIKFLEASVGWVYACTNAIGDEVANIQLKLFRRKGDNVDEIFEHELLNLLSRVNDVTTKFDHFSLTQQYLELVGEAPWYLDRGAGGKIENILLLRPDRLAIDYDDNSDVIVDKYRYLIDTEKYTYKDIEPEDLIPIRYPDPVKPLRGSGPLNAAKETVDLDTFSETWNKNFFYNSAAPDAVLKADGQLTEPQMKRLRVQWDKRFQGLNNNFKMAILEAGLEYEAITPTHTDMNFIEQQKFTRDKIFGIFRVPKAILAQTDGVNLANAKTAENIFARWTIDPKMQRLVEQLNEFLVPNFGDDLFLDYVSPIKDDQEEKRKNYESGINHGYLTPNEVRNEIGKEEIEDGGDKVYLPMNMMPIGGERGEEEEVEETEETEEEEKRIKKRKEFKKKLKRKFNRPDTRYIHKRRRRIKKLDMKGVKRNIYEMVKAMVKEEDENGRKKQKKEEKKKGKKEEDERKKLMGDTFWKGLIKRTDTFEVKYVDILTKYFNRQKRDVLKQLSKKSMKADEIEVDEDFDEDLKVKFDVEKESKKLEKLSLPFLAGVLAIIGNDTKKFWDLPKETEEVDVKPYIKTRTKYIKGVNKTTKKRLDAVIQKGIDEGEGVSKVSKRINNLFTDFTKARSDTIARSEVLRASNYSILETFKNSGVVVGKEWVTAMDSRICPFCLEMEAKTNSLSDSYFAKGDTITAIDPETGKKISMDLDYESIAAPPLHSRCFTKGTIIKTQNGDKKIEDIKKGELVFTHRKRFKSVIGLSKRWYEGDLINLYVGGKKMEVTPNHPLLTTKGWKKAGEIKFTDTLFDISNSFSLNPKDTPSMSFNKSGFQGIRFGMSRSRVPVASIDLDHYMKLGMSKVEVIAAESEFMNKVKRQQNFSSFFFIFTILRRFHNLFGAFISKIFVPSCAMALSSNGFFTNKSWVSILKFNSERTVSWFNTKFLHSSHKRTVINFQNRASLSHRFFLNIVKTINCIFQSFFINTKKLFIKKSTSNNTFTSKRTSKILIHLYSRLFTFKRLSTYLADKLFTSFSHIGIIVHRQNNYKGFVYNFETEEDHSYTANGIVVSNCRCTIRPIIKS